VAVGGWTRVGVRHCWALCVNADIDECATDNGGCPAQSECINTAGSAYCVCEVGYTGPNCTG